MHSEQHSGCGTIKNADSFFLGMDRLIHITEGIRLYKASQLRKQMGIRVYKGDAEKICKKIIEDCWNDEHQYFMTSAGHFCQFYMRDFGLVCKALITLGHKKRVKKTLEYALSHYKRENRQRTITRIRRWQNSPALGQCSHWCESISRANLEAIRDTKALNVGRIAYTR